MKVGREGNARPIVGQFSLHLTFTSHGITLIDSIATCNMVICSTKFQHLDFQKASWMSPNLLANQLDNVVIKGRHVLNCIQCTRLWRLFWNSQVSNVQCSTITKESWSVLNLMSTTLLEVDQNLPFKGHYCWRAMVSSIRHSEMVLYGMLWRNCCKRRHIQENISVWRYTSYCRGLHNIAWQFYR